MSQGHARKQELGGCEQAPEKGASAFSFLPLESEETPWGRNVPWLVAGAGGGRRRRGDVSGTGRGAGGGTRRAPEGDEPTARASGLGATGRAPEGSGEGGHCGLSKGVVKAKLTFAPGAGGPGRDRGCDRGRGRPRGPPARNSRPDRPVGLRLAAEPGRPATWPSPPRSSGL